MALQASSLLPPSPSARSFLGISLADHAVSDFSPRRRVRLGGGVRAQTATTSPSTTVSSPDAKKTLRKGTVIITGASSGLGLATAKALAETGKWHVIMACRDFLKAERAAKSVGMNKENYSVIHLDLASLDSVRQFTDNFRRSGRPLDALVCNAAVYLPTAKEPTFTADGFELSVGTNHLGHFLLARLLLDDLKKSDYPSRRLIIVGSITGGPGGPAGLAGGLNGLNTSSMINGGEFDGAKAYKDSKVCNMLTMQEFHRRFHEETGVTFASLYPGCIATTGLFRSHIPSSGSSSPFPEVVTDPSLGKSGVYWSWNKDSASFQNQLSEEASDPEKARKLWELSEKLVVWVKILERDRERERERDALVLLVCTLCKILF
ncbi:unnamed protein product [Spirodela intermedia]|uniref:NADPH-protochlorophyllide oxidoreductase n=1 Tax=Spirodela intermedia TaxID=51605 RepID=A0A7I8IZU2_SPIIN|nr:unnamed protein product [Spirodela intermedia]CAA6662681.1 unnamed protein product [Spirodela intermedia]